ncbi:MAG: oxaloacetate decarboxylase [Rhodospirillaceae bacterium]|nr:oxaloacetate decarboxylase [Rhodospirillaceae bacterium]
MRRTTRFRQLVEAPPILVMPGVHDALGAKIAEQAGFEAITCGGYAATAALLGEPDTSQLSLTELADHYARLCDAVSIPVFGDGDTGFGNVTNVRRAVRAYERAGLAGMFIEDQTFPKRCGHMPGKATIGAAEMLGKIKAALDARRDPDFVVMARTDALATHGFDEAIARAQLYRDAGADLIFVEALETEAQMRQACAAIHGPVMATIIEGGRTPAFAAAELEAFGFAAATNPVTSVYLYAAAMRDLYARLRETGTTRGFEDRMLSFDSFNALVGLAGLRRREEDEIEFGRRLARRRQKPPEAAE